MRVFIGERHLKADPKKRLFYSDTEQKGFALRVTSNGVASYYYTYLNKNRLHPKTKKPVREWFVIGEHGPKWNPAKARSEATRLAGLVQDGKNLKEVRRKKNEQARARGVLFQQLHDEYIKFCQTPIKKRWGDVAEKESWQDIKSALKRPLAWWKDRVASEITDDDIMELYDSFVRENHVPQANRIRGLLYTMFVWGGQSPRKYTPINPCANLPKKRDEVSGTDDGRVLTPDEIRTFWFGVDDPNCPGDRLSKLALKLSLVTMLRTGEVVAIPRAGVRPTAVTIPLKVLKGRRSKKARDVVQPLNSLAREIIGEIFSIGDPDRRYAFPGTAKRRAIWMRQNTLAHLLNRKSWEKAGKAGINEYLGMEHWTPHTLRRTASTICDQLGYDESIIGKVLTHKTADKNAAPVTRDHYIVKGVQIIERPVDKRVEVLDRLDEALRGILGLPRVDTEAVPHEPAKTLTKPRLLKAA